VNNLSKIQTYVRLKVVQQLENEAQEADFVKSVREEIESRVIKTAESLLDAELGCFIGAAPHQRVLGRLDQRNGHRPGSIVGPFDQLLEIEIPRSRKGFSSKVWTTLKGFKASRLMTAACELWLGGQSTRNAAAVISGLFGKPVSAGYISQATNKLAPLLEAWDNKSLSETKWKYLYLDGAFLKTRRGRPVSEAAVLFALGVTENGEKHLIGWQMGAVESQASWESLLETLMKRGFDVKELKLVITDGHPGLIEALNHLWGQVSRQRCVFHKIKNILSLFSRSHGKEAAKDLHNIFYAPSREDSYKQLGAFETKWGKEYPRACKNLAEDFAACVAFFDCPPKHWCHLRTNNPLESFNGEFKRRTKPMGITAGESSLAKIIWSVAGKAETAWATKKFAQVDWTKVSN
jgi:putative transposase